MRRRVTSCQCELTFHERLWWHGLHVVEVDLADVDVGVRLVLLEGDIPSRDGGAALALKVVVAGDLHHVGLVAAQGVARDRLGTA